MPRFKLFSPRESLLESLIAKDANIRTLWTLIVAIVLVLGMGVIANNFFTSGEFLDFSILGYTFAKLDSAIGLIVGMWSICWTLYILIPATPPSVVVLRVVHIPLSMALAFAPLFGTLWIQLPPATSLLVTMYATVLWMKSFSYAYTRPLLKKTDDRDFLGISMDKWTVKATPSQYIYFIFAPTMLWRPVYPMSQTRSCWKAVWHLIEFSASFLAILEIHMLVFPKLAALNDEERWKMSIFIPNMLKSVLVGLSYLLLVFYALLHSWANMCAEILLFADREFYADWWNAESFSQYYRKWNSVVHDFLFECVYAPLVTNLRGRKKMASFATFMISAIAHEVVISFSFGFFRPWLFVIFGGPGYLLSLPKPVPRRFRRSFSVAFWVGFLIGTGMLIVGYSYAWIERDL